ATVANLGRRNAQNGRRLAHRLGVIAAAHHNRVELAAEDRGDHRARNDAGRGDAHHDLGIVRPGHLDRECARQLAEKRPVHLEDAARSVRGFTSWRHVSSRLAAECDSARKLPSHARGRQRGCRPAWACISLPSTGTPSAHSCTAPPWCAFPPKFSTLDASHVLVEPLDGWWNGAHAAPTTSRLLERSAGAGAPG